MRNIFIYNADKYLHNCISRFPKPVYIHGEAAQAILELSYSRFIEPRIYIQISLSPFETPTLKTYKALELQRICTESQFYAAYKQLESTEENKFFNGHLALAVKAMAERAAHFVFDLPLEQVYGPCRSVDWQQGNVTVEGIYADIWSDKFDSIESQDYRSNSRILHTLLSRASESSFELPLGFYARQNLFHGGEVVHCKELKTRLFVDFLEKNSIHYLVISSRKGLFIGLQPWNHSATVFPQNIEISR